MRISLVALLLACVAGTLHAQTFTLRSDDIGQGAQVANPFVQHGSGCAGGNLSPMLAWSGEPRGTRSFAITVYDPDAPTGSGWWHWTVVNLPPNVHTLARGAGSEDGRALPPGAVQGRTDFTRPGYGGPCPPVGDPTHHYRFIVWALDVDHLPVDTSMSAASIGFMLRTHQLGQAELVPVSTR